VAPYQQLDVTVGRSNDGHQYLRMRRAAARSPPKPGDATASWAYWCDLVSAAEQLQNGGIVHGDIKPQHLRVMGDVAFFIDLGDAVLAGGQCTDAVTWPFVSLGRLTCVEATWLDDLESCVLAWAWAAGVYPAGEEAQRAAAAT
jgi:hypothetical protein